MKFSIIIPTLNEEKTILGCLSALQPLRNECEIIADGGSIENTRMLAAPLADKVIISAKSRAKQMNNGARHAMGIYCYSCMPTPVFLKTYYS
jgi:glycosyltransferase involved in cell wall biosynthesis